MPLSHENKIGDLVDYEGRTARIKSIGGDGDKKVAELEITETIYAAIPPAPVPPTSPAPEPVAENG